MSPEYDFGTKKGDLLTNITYVTFFEEELLLSRRDQKTVRGQLLPQPPPRSVTPVSWTCPSKTLVLKVEIVKKKGVKWMYDYRVERGRT